MLVLDAGNALFKSTEKGWDPKETPRAKLLLEQMDALGTVAMAVGARDLTLGVDFLKEHSKKAKMKLLSANLVDAQGKPLFPASTVVTVGGVKFGLIGLSPAGKVVPGAEGRPLVPAAVAEAKRLRKEAQVDVVVLLAAIPYMDLPELAEKAEGVDFVSQSHDNRGVGMALRNGFVTVVPPGERGRQLAKLELSIDGAGPFVDLSERSRAQDSLKVVEANLAKAQERLAETKDETARQALQSAVGSFEARRAALRKTVGQGATGAGRTHLLSYIQLGGDIPADATLQQLVERIEPPGSAAH